VALTRALLLLCLVASAARAQDPIVERCVAQFPPGAARAHCVSPWLDEIVMKQSVAAALQAAEGLVKSGVMNVNDCHVMGHDIGHASWHKEHDLLRAFRACTSACIQGCMHGAVEAFMMDGPESQTSPEKVRYFCALRSRDWVERRQCLHGLGHGVMQQHRTDLHAATDACESLVDGDERREADLCLGGVWMQWAHFRIYDGAEAYAKVAPGMCDGVRSELLPECARAVGGGAMFSSGHDVAKSNAVCQTLPAAQRDDCRRGVDYELSLIHAGLGGAHSH
jgi:hypothetical protein